MNRRNRKYQAGHCAEPGRFARQGFPEAIFGPGKTADQIISIARRLSAGKGPVMVTRLEKSVYESVRRYFPGSVYGEAARLAVLKPGRKDSGAPHGRYICVVTAGTTDIPVAEEAAMTAEALGSRVERIYDVGVAGVHRLLRRERTLRKASCIIVCAGMEGALASVVGGLAACPVVGVPTSVGYGVSFGGVSALMSMLNSCAANVSAVNIDDGFGAGVIASLINKGGTGK